MQTNPWTNDGLTPMNGPNGSPKAKPNRPPSLRFSPTAWAKLLFLRDAGETEVGGFAITAADDLLFVEDIKLVRQISTPVSVAFDDEAVADFFDEQVDQNIRPERFARIWVHTHPGSCPQPSSTDEETFARVFGRTEWAVMLILARSGETYARLSFHVGPGGSLLIPVSVDYSRPFGRSEQAAWSEEYQASVEVGTPWTSLAFDPDPDWGFDSQNVPAPDDEGCLDWEELLGNPHERPF
ncbi:MAG: hypothetical protein ACLQNE_22380 [Thermoguttaceae bacterium]